MTPILVVDDSPICRRVAERVLGQKFEVHTAADGREAVRAVRNRHYAVILMDIDMPEMNGLEATKLIRLIEQFNGEYTRIVAYSASSDDRIFHCLSVGMDECLNKPATPAQLIDLVDGLVQLASGTTARVRRWTAVA